MAAYQAALAGETAPARLVGEDRAKAGTFAALVAAYYLSAEYKALRESTQVDYRNVIDQLRREIGPGLVRDLKPAHVRALMDAKADAPFAANARLTKLRLLMRFAVERGWRADDPTHAVRRIRVTSEGFRTWSEEEIAAFEARHPVGTRARLALDIALYTAQRRQDVVRFGRQHVRGEKIRVRQLKTGTALALPLHPNLRASLDAAPQGTLTYLVTARGEAFTPAGFTNWFREEVKAAGLEPGLSCHGLRKASARRLAEAGCTAHEIMGVTGHKNLSEVTLYTAAADQERLALAAHERTVSGTPAVKPAREV